MPNPILDHAVENASGNERILWIIVAALVSTIGALAGIIRHLYLKNADQEKEHREDIERLSKARQRERNSR
jgi:flagellar basal body-associated protein FliL